MIPYAFFRVIVFVHSQLMPFEIDNAQGLAQLRDGSDEVLNYGFRLSSMPEIAVIDGRAFVRHDGHNFGYLKELVETVLRRGVSYSNNWSVTRFR